MFYYKENYISFNEQCTQDQKCNPNLNLYCAQSGYCDCKTDLYWNFSTCSRLI